VVLRDIEAKNEFKKQAATRGINSKGFNSKL
jgi:hypothetical protein